MRILTNILILVFCFSFTNAKLLPEDKSYVHGELKNGFKYTIKKNSKPKKKAYIQLVVKAGSLEEDDDQKGLAHFVEHMAFNGTKHFEGNKIIKFLESIGVGFGADINASTTTTRTLYKMDLPLKNDNLEKAMLIFSDWAGAISFDQKELDKERGVILEEARVRNNLNFRLYQQMKGTIYKNSKYRTRTPIGDLDIVKNTSLKRVKDFYDDWYRPELMHLVVTGDIDIKNIENLIKKNFSYLKNKSKRKPANRAVKKIDEITAMVLKDKELIKPGISINYYHDRDKIKTDKDYKQLVLRVLAANLFNIKASEQILKVNPVIKNTNLNSRDFVSNLRTFSFSTTYLNKKDKYTALDELTSLIYSIKHNGFDKNEFKRIVKELKTANNESLKYIKSKSSKSYANKIVSSVLNDEILIDQEYAIKLVDKILSNVTLNEVNNKYKQILDTKSIILSYKTPLDIKVDKKKIIDTFIRSQKHIKKAKKEEELPEVIDTSYLKPVKIKNEKHNKKYDFYEFTLENGIKVVYKYSDDKKNKVFLNAISRGGFSLYKTKDLVNAKYATSVISSSGLDKYNILQVNKIYNSKIISVNPKINRYNESLQGATTIDDFNLLMQRVYLMSKKYRFDNNIFENIKNTEKRKIKDQESIPSNKFNKELKSFYFNHNKRFERTSVEDINSLNKEDMLRIYKDRYSDFNNFTFLIVGDISKEKVEKYSKLYLGNLPTLKREESYKYRGIKPLSGKQEFIRDYNNRNLSKIKMIYKIDTSYSLENSVYLTALKEVLKIKLREKIREEKSGVYRINVQTSFIREPYVKSGIQINFSCDPKRKEELVSSVREVISDIKKNGVSKVYIQAFRKKALLSLESSKNNPAFWLQQLKKVYYYGDNINDIDKYKDLYTNINSSIIKQEANKYFDAKDVLYTELNPKHKNK
ncbi:pitrilysin family protein [Arcobacter sp. CECT 8985]|uniref:M16 family metallopeptidase n=1 Tax=Arcobacter sp. CECT 8985 TaxID=1935424 RepID=UPI00100ABA55|nr:M16 family metallopeptidase [Arcobacter sp. CECT 8985]RXJ86850.1 hypothetical protein CRU93_06510 [Arcobacter sp. CECT 8985]